MEVLRAMYPNVTIPEPEAFHMARWDTNTIYRGSYSNWPPSFVNGHAQNLRANVGKRLWFAGEATSLKYFGGWKNLAYCGIDRSDNRNHAWRLFRGTGNCNSDGTMYKGG